ncbi:Crp/Fnr family transcriptional regulator [Bacteroidota bacterium]|nr:Crp/Fnr family transcriptional regulator [Bacteroidota bacterium]
MHKDTKTPYPTCQFCSSREASVFCDLNHEDLEEINMNKGANHYKKGQVIFEEGFRPQGIFCINEGKIKIAKRGDRGKEQIIRLAKDGDIIGYRALISGENYSASAYALEDSIVCMIPRQQFTETMQRNPALTHKLIYLLTHDLKLAEHKITELAQKPVRERLAESLIMLKQTYGFEKDNKTLNVVLSREDFANLVGTATETVIRLLSDFNSEKLIQLDGKKISLLNVPKLLSLANIED